MSSTSIFKIYNSQPNRQGSITVLNGMHDPVLYDPYSSVDFNDIQGLDPGNVIYSLHETLFAVDSATVISVGDIVYLDTDDVRPASSQADQGTPNLNYEELHDNFAGVAMESSPAGDDSPIYICTQGEYIFSCNSATFEVGTLVCAAENAGGTALENQKVVGVGTKNLSIGRAIRRVNPAGTSVRVLFNSTIVWDGAQAAA